MFCNFILFTVVCCATMENNAPFYSGDFLTLSIVLLFLFILYYLLYIYLFSPWLSSMEIKFCTKVKPFKSFILSKTFVLNLLACSNKIEQQLFYLNFYFKLLEICEIIQEQLLNMNLKKSFNPHSLIIIKLI